MMRSNDYIDDVVASQDDTIIPIMYRKWAVLSSVLGALGRKCWIDRGAFVIRPNMYIIMTGEPANGKTAALQLPLTDIFEAISWKPPSKPDSTDWNPLITRHDMDDCPLVAFTGAITPESLGEEMAKAHHIIPDLTTMDGGLFHDNSGTFITEEFSVFIKKDNPFLQGVLTSLWDANTPYRYKTRKAGSYVVQGPCLNWIACSTPTNLIDCLPPTAAGQGLLSRFMVVHDDAPRQREQLKYPSPDFAQIEKFREELARIGKLKGEFMFDSEMEDYINEDLAAGVQPEPTAPILINYNGRRVSMILKVAMGMSASRINNMVINMQDWERAKAWVHEAEARMPKVLNAFGTGKAGQTSDEIVKYVTALTSNNGARGIHDRVLRREVLRKANNPGEVEALINTMLHSSILKKDLQGYYKVCDGAEETPETTH